MTRIANTVTVAEYRAAVARAAGARGPKARPTGPYASQLEADYAVELDRRKLAGEIQHWDYEPEKLRLALRTFYTPDFRVVVEGRTEMHEVKGYLRRYASLTLRFAAEQFPQYTFVLVQRRKGAWTLREMGGEA